MNLIHDGHITVFRKEDGLLDNYIIVLYQDYAGSIWIGTGDGLSRYKDGQFTNWTTKDGLASGRINEIYEDQSGALWISAQNGLPYSGVSDFLCN